MARGSGGRYRRRLAAEQQAAAVYRALVAKRTGEDREILLALARAEERHALHQPQDDQRPQPAGEPAEQPAAAPWFAGRPLGGVKLGRPVVRWCAGGCASWPSEPSPPW